MIGERRGPKPSNVILANPAVKELVDKRLLESATRTAIVREVKDKFNVTISSQILLRYEKLQGRIRAFGSMTRPELKQAAVEQIERMAVKVIEQLGIIDYIVTDALMEIQKEDDEAKANGLPEDRLNAYTPMFRLIDALEKKTNIEMRVLDSLQDKMAPPSVNINLIEMAPRLNSILDKMKTAGMLTTSQKIPEEYLRPLGVDITDKIVKQKEEEDLETSKPHEGKKE